MIDQVRAHVAESLKDLDGVLALRRTSAGTAPFLFHSGDDASQNVSQLVLEPRYPLALMVSRLQKRHREAKIGVVARGCDARALVEMAKRFQIDPDRLYLLGIACTSQEAEACFCAEPAPDLEQWPQAIVIGEPVVGAPPNPMVAEYDKMPLEERQAFWQRQFLKCIKCYGCRNICPECFCEACAMEDPLWVEPGVLAPPFPTFHLIRAMHMATRCIACRHCELACPSHIPLTVLYDLMLRDVDNLLQYVPGADVEARPPLSLTLSDEPIKELV
ncbi:MAG: 4Fe-4S ferredoxin [Anaerolineae bacterium]|jgi:ferredoxin